VLGVGEPCREAGVGRQQEEARARQIEPADRDERFRFVAKKIEDGFPRFGISPRRHDAPRLVQRDRAPCSTVRWLSVDRYRCTFGDDKVRGIGDQPAADRDFAAEDEPPGIASRRQAELGQCAIESNTAFHPAIVAGTVDMAG
jgi:hypothetical protein